MSFVRNGAMFGLGDPENPFTRSYRPGTADVATLVR